MSVKFPHIGFNGSYCKSQPKNGVYSVEQILLSGENTVTSV